MNQAQHHTRILVAIIAAAIVFLTACGVPFVSASCATQAQPFLDQIEPIAREWDDAAALAGQTPRMALSAQIEKLQAVRRKAQDLAPPACAQPVKDELVKSMDATIQGFLDFLAQKPDSTVQVSFVAAQTHMTAFGDRVAEIRGQPTSPTVNAVFDQINSGLNP
jgi:hypothetical protein